VRAGRGQPLQAWGALLQLLPLPLPLPLPPPPLPASAPSSAPASGHMAAADKENMGGGAQAHMGSCVSFARTLSSIRATGRRCGGAPGAPPEQRGPRERGEGQPRGSAAPEALPPSNGLPPSGHSARRPLPTHPQGQQHGAAAGCAAAARGQGALRGASSAATSPPRGPAQRARAPAWTRRTCSCGGW